MTLTHNIYIYLHTYFPKYIYKSEKYICKYKNIYVNMYKVHALCVHGIFGFQDSSDFATLWYFPYEFLIPCIMMMMIAFITINSGLVPLIEGLCDV